MHLSVGAALHTRHMSGAPMAVIPRWVAPTHHDIAECHRIVVRLADVTGSHEALGQVAALGWVVGLRPTPLTQREERVSRGLVRAEHWLALCAAAEQPEPTETDWRRFGVEARPVVAGDAEFAYGAWAVLGWLLGERLDPPIALPRRAADGSIAPDERLYVTRPRPDSPAWQDAQRRRRERLRDEALAAWRRTREATATG
jgi:hypothetical protein